MGDITPRLVLPNRIHQVLFVSFSILLLLFLFTEFGVEAFGVLRILAFGVWVWGFGVRSLELGVLLWF
jgi:hypothetical protein